MCERDGKPCEIAAQLLTTGDCGLVPDRARATTWHARACKQRRDDNFANPADSCVAGPGEGKQAARDRVLGHFAIDYRTRACTLLADAYETGSGVAKDPARAAELRHLAADPPKKR